MFIKAPRRILFASRVPVIETAKRRLFYKKPQFKKCQAKFSRLRLRRGRPLIYTNSFRLDLFSFRNRRGSEKAIFTLCEFGTLNSAA